MGTAREMCEHSGEYVSGFVCELAVVLKLARYGNSISAVLTRITPASGPTRKRAGAGREFV